MTIQMSRREKTHANSNFWDLLGRLLWKWRGISCVSSCLASPSKSCLSRAWPMRNLSETWLLSKICSKYRRLKKDHDGPRSTCDMDQQITRTLPQQVRVPRVLYRLQALNLYACLGNSLHKTLPAAPSPRCSS